MQNVLNELTRGALPASSLSQLLPIWSLMYKQKYGKLELDMNSPFKPTKKKTEDGEDKGEEGEEENNQNEHHEMAVLQVGTIQAGTVMNAIIEIIRFVRGKETNLHEIGQFIYVFWNCEKLRKYGYTTLSQLCLSSSSSSSSSSSLSSSSSFLQSISLPLEQNRYRCADFTVCDAQGGILKGGVVRDGIRYYKVKCGELLSVGYVVGDAITKPNSVHHV